MHVPSSPLSEICYTSYDSVMQEARRENQAVGETRGQWPYRPAATRAMRNRLVVLNDLN